MASTSARHHRSGVILRLATIATAAFTVAIGCALFDITFSLDDTIDAQIVEGDPSNFKVTSPADLRMAELILERRAH